MAVKSELEAVKSELEDVKSELEVVKSELEAVKSDFLLCPSCIPFLSLNESVIFSSHSIIQHH